MPVWTFWTIMILAWAIYIVVMLRVLKRDKRNSDREGR